MERYPDVKSVEEYMDLYFGATRKALEEIRETVKKSAPEAEESIAYGMPAYKVAGKPLVYFGAHKSHIGFYATPSGHSEFALKLKKYKGGKGSVQFPLSEPMPLELIAEIVKFRIAETLSKAGKK